MYSDRFQKYELLQIHLNIFNGHIIPGKEEILAQNETKFLNSVNLLCEVFEHMRLADGTVINVLAVPILEYCDILITTPSAQTVNLLGRQLQVS